MSDINKLMHWKPVISSHRFDSQANATALSYSFLISVMFQFSFVSCWLGLEKKKKDQKTWILGYNMLSHYYDYPVLSKAPGAVKGTWWALLFSRNYNGLEAFICVQKSQP